MYNPVSTYRIQFHKGFTFNDLEHIIPYLQQLGIKTLYASPIFKAVPGSTHGYDGTDPLTINPEIGTEEQLRKISRRLKEINIGWMQDIVPNHMAFHYDNIWLMDALENGPHSTYASFFDINWDEQPMVPFLGASLDEVLANNELSVARDNGKLVLQYYDNKFPLSPGSYNSNEQPDDITGNPERLRELISRQHYRLCHWQETNSKINFRRFFTINGLICLNIQNREVFDLFHKKIKAFVDEGIFNGLRIDHIDGLSDPAKYLEDLRALVGDNVPVVVEKILEPGENLPSDWPVQGNTGYDFLSLVNNLLTNRKSKKSFTHFYKKLLNHKRDSAVHRQLAEKKALILFNYMAGELENLYRLFTRLQLAGVGEEDKKDVKAVIAQFLVECPVYRYYGNSLPLYRAEEAAVRDIFNRIKEQRPELVAAVNMLEDVLLVKPREHISGYNDRAAQFYKRCMQFTGPLMAKGVEDTLMYTYNRFIGHNDVGDAPDAFGITVEEFHHAMLERQQYWPLSLNATATHDTKRGEDVRARLNVLTEFDGAWMAKATEWREMNAGLKQDGFPDANDEYFIYQVLTGMYPFPGQNTTAVKERLDQYIEKSLREAKTHSNWATFNAAYETATKEFIAALLDEKNNFLQSFKDFQKQIIDYGICNSLIQAALKFTCPGVPDTYQGTEFWDLSLVDPDNRLPVDYAARYKELEYITGVGADILSQLWERRYDGSIKLWLTYHLLQLRSVHPDLFAYGNYIPLQVKGKYKDHVCAFIRRYKETWCLVAVPLHLPALTGGKVWSEADWKDTYILLPADAPAEWEHMSGGEKIKWKQVDAASLFKALPVAVWMAKRAANKRGAGILLAISSLPSDYGIGDFGSHARKFADFLSRCHQKYWQILPLNPINASSGYSPYSSISSMAGNTLLLDPEWLVAAGLLNASELQQFHLPQKDRADYEAAESVKEALLGTAYKNFKLLPLPALKKEFEVFCKKEARWLNDFAAYVVLKRKHHNMPWYEWPEPYKHHDEKALHEFNKNHDDEVTKVKWLQLLFSLQWKELKAYCNRLGITILGDMPFYVNYDSVDVWANPQIFCLDERLALSGVAGVPPDYFSEDGQLWGTPTFNWNAIEKQNYDWWICRLKKNLELFDLVRFDHFRAFAEYWQVPANEETARNGEWKPGPGKKFFDVIKQELGNLPFVAEDLGDNMDKVYALRDEIGLPGMKVLQFAFSDNMPESVDIPHNHTPDTIVYTGTHDNNTTLGWYQQESNRADHKRLEEYNGTSLREKDVHLVLGRMAYSSVANMAILQMQDVLGLPSNTRMNTPGTATDNWRWRMTEDQMSGNIERLLRNWVYIYHR